jgi:hypothetical protein
MRVGKPPNTDTVIHCSHRAGLPDGLFSDQNSKFLQILEGLAMEDVGIFYGDSVYFMAIWNNLRET